MYCIIINERKRLKSLFLNKYYNLKLHWDSFAAADISQCLHLYSIFYFSIQPSRPFGSVGINILVGKMLGLFTNYVNITSCAIPNTPPVTSKWEVPYRTC